MGDAERKVCKLLSNCVIEELIHPDVPLRALAGTTIAPLRLSCSPRQHSFPQHPQTVGPDACSPCPTGTSSRNPALSQPGKGSRQWPTTISRAIGTEREGSYVSFRQVVESIHSALERDAMRHAEHMPRLMGGHLQGTEKKEV